MTVPVSNSIPRSGNRLIDGLVQGSSWRFGGGPHTLTYSFTRAFDTDGAPPSWTAEFRDAVDRGFDAWEAVANVNFVRVGGSGSQYQNQSTADIAIALERGESVPILGMGIFPSPAFADELLQGAGYSRNAGAFPYTRPEGDIVFAGDRATFDHLTPGASGFGIILHEIGHALGLKHPTDDGGNSRPTFDALGIGSLNGPRHTVMGTGRLGDSPSDFHNPGTPMPLDILAVQRIYGANMTYHAGDNVYVPGTRMVWRTIWDAGGEDTFDASSLEGSFADSVTLDLNPGAFSGPVVNNNRYTAIAYNVVIENAIGTSGNDTLIGNSAANRLTGGAGNDTLDGRGGADTMIGGSGADAYFVNSRNDALVESGDGGGDIVQSSVSFALPEGLEDLTLTGNANINGTGNALANNLTGNSGNNTLIPGHNSAGGLDALSGGGGNDTYDLRGTDRTVFIREEENAGIDTVLAARSELLPDNVENLKLTGSGDINGTGNLLDNVLTGNGGINTLTGLLGDDTYIVQSVADVVVEALDQGTDTLVAPFSASLLNTNLENLTLSGTGNVDGTGNTGNNILTGNSGINTLTGGLGDDIYVIQNEGDAAVESGNEGIDTVFASVSYSLAPNLENLTLTGNAVLSATGNDIANTLTGNSAASTLTGGLGDDTYAVTNAGQLVQENTGEGTDVVQSTVTYSLAANVETLLLTGGGDINGTGNALANTLTGNSGDNVLDGKGGADILNGGGGNDTLVWSAADQSYNGSGGTDTLRVDGANKTLNLLDAPNDWIRNIEVIDITGSGKNRLELTFQDVIDLSSSTNILRVEGNAGDVVDRNGGWTLGADRVIAGETYHSYTQGLATLLVDSDITSVV